MNVGPVGYNERKKKGRKKILNLVTDAKTKRMKWTKILYAGMYRSQSKKYTVLSSFVKARKGEKEILKRGKSVPRA